MYFEYDVFISYPHLDNREDRGGDGWVEKFHEDLDRRLTEALGRPARIWRDDRMAVGTSFREAIFSHLRKSAVLLCVLSPSYLRSQYCSDELRGFREAAVKNGGLAIGEQSRVVAAVKTPVDRVPEGLRESLDCKFYDVSGARGGVPHQFSQLPGGYKYEEYSARVGEVAWGIRQVVMALGDEEPPAEDERPTVYLAEATTDRAAEVGEIREELEKRGFVVLPDPDAPLPSRTAEQYAAAVRECLRRSFMSVHVMGSAYGNIPEGARGRSLPRIQNELAAKRGAGDGGFVRLIWIPKELGEVEAEQAAFLDRLREDEVALDGAELLERSLQEVKTRLFQILKRREEEEEEERRQPLASPGGRLSIYLMCDKADDHLLEPVGGFLFGKGFNVLPPAENPRKRLRHHKKCLVRCDATLTIYGKADFDWVLDRYDEVVKKAMGYGRKSEIKHQAILPTDPETGLKSKIFLHSVKVLPPCYNGVTPRALKDSFRDFIEALGPTPAPAEGGTQ